MELIFQILIVIFSILIIKSNGEKRLAYFFIALFLIPQTVAIFPYPFYFKEHLIFVTCFLISVYQYRELSFKDFSRTIIFIPMILVLVALVLVGLMDERLSAFTGIYRVSYVFESTYGTLLVGWLAITKRKSFDINVFLRQLIHFSIFVSIFGIYTYIIKTNPVLDSIGFEDRFLKEAIGLELRSFRVTAFCVSSSVYGFICGMFSFLSMVILKDKKIIDKIAIILLFANCILSGTRAAIIPVLLIYASYIAYLSFRFKIKSANVVKYFYIGVFLFISVFSFTSSSLTRIIDGFTTMIISVVDDKAQEEVEGSTMQARGIQIATAWEYFKEKPLFGHGIAYYAENISDGEHHEKLLGMESYLCFLGIEYGGVFSVCILTFFISLLIYFYKTRKIDRDLALCGFLITFNYVLFLCFAWIGDSWMYVLPILGLIARILYNKQHNI